MVRILQELVRTTLMEVVEVMSAVRTMEKLYLAAVKTMGR